MSVRILPCDVVVAGLGLGAIAAALRLADAGARVVMAGAESRIGGQVTTQLTSPLDEHPLIESTGCTRRYRAFRDAIRAEYGGADNPGGGWVSRLCFEPAVGERVLEAMLAPWVGAGAITVILGARPIRAEREHDRLTGVRFGTADGDVVVRGTVFVDATETGDLLPLADAEWVIGSEGRDAFGEPHALPGGPNPKAEQSCTVVAALRRDPVAGPVGPAPVRYQELRESQPFSLTLSNGAGAAHEFPMFDDTVAPGSFWSYRRVRDPRTIGGDETAIINWHGNDYFGSGLVAQPDETDAGARELALAFVHWLRTEAPRDDGGFGHPELRLAPEVSGTSDGLAEAPYVRESRRLHSPAPVTEHDLAPRPGVARARPYADSIGVAWYHADLHPRVGGHDSVYAPTAPFQVPLRSLVCETGAGPVNLIAGAKNLAATQIAAAAYRVHPGEWAIGEAAGVLAAHALHAGISPAAAVADPRHRIIVQIAALRGGAPIIWATDLPVTHPAFVAASLLLAHGGLDLRRRATLSIEPDVLLDVEADADLRAAAARLSASIGIVLPPTEPASGATWAERAIDLVAPILEALGVQAGHGRSAASTSIAERAPAAPSASRTPTVPGRIE